MIRILRFLITVLIIFSGGLTAQENNNNIIPDPRLSEVFTYEQIQDFLKTNPEKIFYYNYFLDHSYFISTVVEGKPVHDLNISSVKSKSGSYFSEDLNNFVPEHFNVLKYDFCIQYERYSHYILGNTDKVMVFYPKKVFEESYKEYLNSLGYSNK